MMNRGPASWLWTFGVLTPVLGWILLAQQHRWDFPLIGMTFPAVFGILLARRIGKLASFGWALLATLLFLGVSFGISFSLGSFAHGWSLTKSPLEPILGGFEESADFVIAWQHLWSGTHLGRFVLLGCGALLPSLAALRFGWLRTARLLLVLFPIVAVFSYGGFVGLPAYLLLWVIGLATFGRVDNSLLWAEIAGIAACFVSPYVAIPAAFVGWYSGARETR